MYDGWGSMAILKRSDGGEIVIGLITTLGTDVRDVIQLIEDRLAQYNYETEQIKVSSEIIAQFDKTTSRVSSESERISHFMDLGDSLRTIDTTLLMKGVAAKIFERRETESFRADSGQEFIEAQPRKGVAVIINSIKHPDEVQFLRETYTTAFHLLAITADDDSRRRYLTENKGMSNEEADELLQRDRGSSLDYGQKTEEAFQNADYFIHISDSERELRSRVFRLIDLIFGDPFITPTFEEYAMFKAYAASLRSADLSRQIGAVVAKNNEILSTGVNDCPRFGGGLYWSQLIDGEYKDEPLGRDYTLGYDSNKIEQEEIISNILREFQIENNAENKSRIKRAGIGDLTEYGRVVHAEMEALLACSRNHIDCRGASMYMTTFPCHNCAKHIIAAGIKDVYYIEPYPKSKALKFYKREISTRYSDTDKVRFLPFSGVGPRRYIDLFSMASSFSYKKKRKDSSGYRLDFNKATAYPRNNQAGLSYLEKELSAYLYFLQQVDKHKG